MPGRFTNAAIQKALQVSERAFGALSVQLLLPGRLDARQQDSLELLAGISLHLIVCRLVSSHQSK